MPDVQEAKPYKWVAAPKEESSGMGVRVGTDAELTASLGRRPAARTDF
jgi:hypothetical protein